MIVGMVLCLLAPFWAVLFLRNLGKVLSACGTLLGEDTAAMLGGIFGQLATARIVPGIAVPLLFAVVYGGMTILRARQRRAPTATPWCRVSRVLLLCSPLAVLVSLGCALFFAAVNDVLFGDIVVSLAKMAANGLFDVL